MREAMTKEIREAMRESKRIIKQITGINMKDIVETSWMINGYGEESIDYSYYECKLFKLENRKSYGSLKKITVVTNKGTEKRWVALGDWGKIMDEFYEVLNIGDEEHYTLMKTSEVNKLECKVKVHARFEEYDEAKRRMDMLNKVVDRCMKGE